MTRFGRYAILILMTKKCSKHGMVRMRPDTQKKLREAKDSLKPSPTIEEMVDYLLQVGLRHYMEEMKKP